jgi:hypothetical protein
MAISQELLMPDESTDEHHGHEGRIWCLDGRRIMKLICASFGVAVMCTVGLAAQSGTTETKTKVDVKNGKDVKVTGCLERDAAGGGYVLTSSRGSFKYALVTDDDLSKAVGRRVEVKGKAADRGDGNVKVESSVGTSGKDKTEAKTEMKGPDMAGMRYLGVKSVKTIAGTCQ